MLPTPLKVRMPPSLCSAGSTSLELQPQPHSQKARRGLAPPSQYTAPPQTNVPPSGGDLLWGLSVLVTFPLLLGQIPDTQNEGRKGLFNSQFMEGSVHIGLAQG